MTHLEFTLSTGVLVIMSLLFGAKAPEPAMVLGSLIALGLVVYQVLVIIAKRERTHDNLH